MKLGQAAQEVAELVTNLGVPATVDPQLVQIPGAWVTVRRVSHDRLDGASFTIPFAVYLIAGDYDTPAVLDELGSMLELVSPYVEGDAQAVQLVLPNHGPPSGMPALLVTLPFDVT